MKASSIMTAGSDQPKIRQASDDVDVGRLIAIVWAGRGVITAWTLAALAIAVFLTIAMPPTYRADATVQLEQRGGSLTLPDGLEDLVSNDPRTDAEIEILTSRMVLSRVVAELNLDWRTTPARLPLIGSIMQRYRLPIPDAGFLRRYARPGESIELRGLRVPPRWIGVPIRLIVLDRHRYRIMTPDGHEHDGKVGQPLMVGEAGLLIRIGRIDAPSGRRYELVQEADLATIIALRRSLGVREKGRDTGILRLTYESRNMRQAERVLNGVTEAYLDQNIARSAAEVENSLAFIEKQLPNARAELRTAEAALNDYRQRQKSVDISFETESLLTQITRLEAELRALRAREDEVSERYTKSHPVYQQLLTRMKRLRTRLSEVRRDVDNLPETQREVVNLNRAVQLKQEIYTQLQTRAQEVRVLRASTVGNVRILDTAQTAPDPIAPRRPLILGLSVVLGIFLGICVVLGRHWLRRGVQGSDELEAVGLPVFATINFTPGATEAEAEAETSHGTPGLLALAQPASIAAEAFRSLRTSLHFGMLDAETRSLAITSAAPNAGKSFVAANLGVITAQAGQSVCLVDADLRQGRLRRLFGLGRDTPGLSEYLSGEIDLEEAVTETGVPGLHVITTGRYPPNPSELLMRPRLRELVTRLNGVCDLSIVDCPPVLAVTDPVIVGRATGATIAVVRHDITPIAEIGAMQRALEGAGIRLSGAILNAFDPRRVTGMPGDGYTQYYRYEYRARHDEV